jgi:oleate hydratase
MWHKIAAQDPSFGHPDVFCDHEAESNWMSATIDLKDDTVIPYIKAICKRDPHSGKVTTGGIVTVKDSQDGWFLSWTINRQPQFKSQPKTMSWSGSMAFTPMSGNYIKKPMKECTGKEIARSGFTTSACREKIAEYAEKHMNTTTCYMPYINAFFMPRHVEDRPLVVPRGLRELRLHRPIRRDAARYDLHDRIFDSNRHGSGLHLDERRPGRARDLGQRL